MLSEELKKEIQQCYSTLLKNKQVNPRKGQRIMMADIARFLDQVSQRKLADDVAEKAASKTDQKSPDTHNVAVIEAGTGTGKTLAYCIVSLIIARALKKKVIISTATIALQEQIIYKDLPELKQLSDLDFSFTLAKGRKRYLCLSRLNNYLQPQKGEQQQLHLLPAEPLTTNNKKVIDLALYRKFREQLDKNRWNGERDSWKTEIDNSSWLAVTSDHHQCHGKHCSEYQQCIFFRARERVFKSDCVVVNHDLLLSDLALGGGKILPEPQECLFVIDEAHHLPEKAVAHFSYNMQMYSSSQWLRQLSEQLNELSLQKGIPGKISQLINDLPDLVNETDDSICQLIQLFEQQLNFASNNTTGKIDASHRFPKGKLNHQFYPPFQQLERLFQLWQTQIETLNEFCEQVLEEKRNDMDKKTAEFWNQLLLAALNRIEAGTNLCRQYIKEEDIKKHPPYARWIDRISVHQDNKNLPPKQDYVLHCSPILPAAELYSLLWSRCFAAILTSATLSSNGNFRLLQLRTGIDGFFDIIHSHFNYRQQVTFHIPAMTSDPSRDVAQHTEEVATYLLEHIDPNEATLVLFSSKKQLQDVEYTILKQRRAWKKLILTQGNANKQQIMKQHKKNIDAGNGSMIFGLDSFAEGVDLPGKYCTHVIICKLPFSVPDNPVDETLAEWLREEQGKNHFFEVSVPQATIKLVQACGRLIRQETDQGKITLLDRRILSKSYGRDMLNSLPDYHRDFH